MLWIDITEPTIEELTPLKSLKGKEDFLLYRILDAIVDDYVSVIEDFEDKMDEIDEEVLENPTVRTIEKIRMLIRQIRHIHRIIRGQRDVVDKLERSDTAIIKPETKIYFRDVYDHTISLLDSMDNIQGNAEGALEVYHSSLANKMNEIMKMLTTIATIFIPLTFLAGVYGMNFRYMPELEWRWGYFTALFLSIIRTSFYTYGPTKVDQRQLVLICVNILFIYLYFWWAILNNRHEDTLA